MPNQFDQDLQETIERCRRLARATNDMGMASKLLALADDMEKARRGIQDGDAAGIPR